MTCVAKRVSMAEKMLRQIQGLLIYDDYDTLLHPYHHHMFTTSAWNKCQDTIYTKYYLGSCMINDQKNVAYERLIIYWL